MNNEIFLLIITFVISVQIQLSISDNHCSKSAIMNIIMEQCSRQKRETRHYSNYFGKILAFHSEWQHENRRNHNHKLRRSVTTTPKIYPHLYQVSGDFEGLTGELLSTDDMDDILEYVQRTPRSYKTKDDIIRDVAICCQDIQSCRKNKSIINCP